MNRSLQSLIDRVKIWLSIDVRLITTYDLPINLLAAKIMEDPKSIYGLSEEFPVGPYYVKTKSGRIFNIVREIKMVSGLQYVVRSSGGGNYSDPYNYIAVINNVGHMINLYLELPDDYADMRLSEFLEKALNGSQAKQIPEKV